MISAASSGFAALHHNGTVVGWPTAFASAPSGTFVSIYSSQNGFTAIDVQGRLHAWGSAGQGAGLPATSGHVQLVSATSAWASLSDMGRPTDWGLRTSVFLDLDIKERGHTRVVASDFGFAALDGRGRITTWGQGSAVTPVTAWSPQHDTRGGYISIVASRGGFAALNIDGSLTSWGSNSGQSAPTGHGFVELFSTATAFAALSAPPVCAHS